MKEVLLHIPLDCFNSMLSYSICGHCQAMLLAREEQGHCHSQLVTNPCGSPYEKQSIAIVLHSSQYTFILG